MKSYQITPGVLQGFLEIPSSKSHTLRAILFGLMGEGKTTIYKYLESTDSLAMIAAIKNFGAKVAIFPNRLEIEGVGGKLGKAEDVIDSLNSGLVLRLIGAIAALSPTYTIITGDHSIRHHRPILPLLSALSHLGVLATSARLDGHAPIIIKGPFEGGETTISGEDSQPVSGLLIASSFAPKETIIHVKNPGEKRWIDLTLYWLDKLGLKYENRNYKYFRIPGGGKIKGFEYTVPGDFSTLAYPLVAAILTDSEISIGNINMDDIQGDKKLIPILTAMGASITIDKENHRLEVKSGGKLKGATIDINECIDALPILAVIGCFAEGETILTNASIARKKECDRIHAITTELKKMGADIQEKEDGLIIRGSPLKGATLMTYHDHRMVMSLSVAAQAAIGPSLIHGVEWVSKTYPSFREHFQSIGAQIKEIE